MLNRQRQLNMVIIELVAISLFLILNGRIQLFLCKRNVFSRIVLKNVMYDKA